jgi:hypothetical protein
MSDDPMHDRIEEEERKAAIAGLLLTATNVALDAMAGRRPDGREIANSLIGAALAFVPEADLREMLTPAGVMRAERMADALSKAVRGGS